MEGREEDGVGLLEQRRRGQASTTQTFGNVIISIIGTGVLGLPYAFTVSGWFAGVVSIVVASSLSYYCMMLLVKCKEKLEESENVTVITYGDLGAHTCGRTGRLAAETVLVISQCGGCVAYFVFVGQNLSSIFTNTSDKFSMFIYILLPLQVALSWIRTLSSLAPFSILADVCNLLAMATVIKDDIFSFQGMSNVKAFRGWESLPFVIGVSVYCFEGFGMVLPLEASMKRPERFRRVLGQGLFSIVFAYACFGFAGYLAFCDHTMDIITLSLPNDWSSVVIKGGLCIGILLTFPVMMHPVHEMFEVKLLGSQWFQKVVAMWPWMEIATFMIIRNIFVIALAVMASSVAKFGVFVSLVGSTVSSMLAFVFPALFHLIAFRGCNSFARKSFDIALIICGVALAIFGTYDTIRNQ